MPKNTAGGSKHKKHSNAESSTSKKSRQLFENILSDVRDGDFPDTLHIGKVVRKLGQGRMEVNYIHEDRLHAVRAPVRGALSGRGKKDAFIDVNSIVLISETGMDSGITHEIIGVLSASQLSALKGEMTLDPRLFAGGESGVSDGIEFDTIVEEPASTDKAGEPKELDIDTI